jgi:hypothetical protein
MSENNYIYAQAKVEYTNQLIDLLKENFFDKFLEIYNESKKETNSQDSIFLNFRKSLEKVPTWNQNTVQTESDSLVKCDWIDDLITAVYLTHTKILLSVGKNDKNKKIDLTIPKTHNFIHKCFIVIARELWKNPYLYKENIKASDYQKNINSIETIISDGIKKTIRSTLPVKDILKGQLVNSLENDSSNNDESEINNSENIQEELKKELLKEILDKKDTFEKLNTEEPSEYDIIKNTTGLQVNDDLMKTTEDREEIYDNPNIFEKKSESNYYTGEDYNLNKETMVEPVPVSTALVETVPVETISIEPVSVEPVPVSTRTVESIVEQTKPIQQTQFETLIRQPEPEPEQEQELVCDKNTLNQKNEVVVTKIDPSQDQLSELKQFENPIKTTDTDDTDTLDNFFDDLKELTNKSTNYSLI